ncbi:MAG TPA: HAD family phosphatase [Anaerolineales bacterium]|nr:HAD family phosphatase [Anaerolineales bacterium]
MAIKGVLWDMDGVLVDTGDFHYQAWSSTLDQYRIPYSREKFNETFGMNNWSILALLLGPQLDQDTYEKISNQKEESFRQVIHGKVKLLPGVLKTLENLQSRGIRQAIASCAPPENIAALVDELQLRNHFEAVVSGYAMAGKPAPDVFLAAARAIDINPHECLVIEDAVTGVKGAKRAGMACLAVTNTHPAKSLGEADRVVDSLDEINQAEWEILLR